MQNWSKNVDFNDRGFLQPESLTELQEAVRSNAKLRARGTAHCFNEIANTSSYAVNLSKMPKTIEVNPGSNSVTVAAGLKYGELAPVLHQQGWALNNLASLPHISIAGSISTGTHGSGIRNQNLANQVLSLDLVTAEAELRHIDRTNPAFNALVVGLGLGGIVYQYELKIEPTFEIRQVIYPEIPLDVLQRSFDQIMGSAYSVSYFTDWGSNQVGNLWCKFRDDEVIPESIGGSANADKKYHPIPSVDPVACTDQLGEPGNWHERLSHFKLDFTPSVGEEIQTEFFVDRKDASAAIEAVSKLGSEISPLLWITELRTVAADELWLSGSYQRDTFAIHFTWKKDEEIYPVIEKVEAALRPFNYRPHWGKVFTADAQYLKSVYPKMSEFKALVDALDPNKKFENSFTRRFLA
ncbi:GlcD FAD/FMN-containing dehydrogenases [Candidatus Nanopelagicaceae bacterium]